jgi:hypothetical protein
MPANTPSKASFQPSFTHSRTRRAGLLNQPGPKAGEGRFFFYFFFISDQSTAVFYI